MSEINLTLGECERSVAWALAETEKIPYVKGSWNAHQFLIKEQCLGLADAGATAYKCRVGFNIDFDVRCTCCGEILELGSVDIEGPLHDTSDDTGPVVLARSAGELMTALGAAAPKGRTRREAALYIWETLRRAKACSCP
jgi:hypothetical protein